ncbi:NADH-FMN oxidoreductase RutF, flavin reductase (DIM6/NTAB) family [Marinobacter daqiaonensis]|uniref:NADH-FMN oxidoreductase RutF, flavin reductase (DIM6/NTAB) family n=1 Tax=Marinobacter daqiaonensis TaxID=650891 RepID=A0A1I6HHV2_9GAMM|nr:flavin reductase family protein [Marinobacter daqiaonensis]SFR53954.1 NADH-FMN oxidoreductase RutF, flavin reductase (DIM6/NTAB) family [Marinobacter daqiaonensis]
MTEDRHFYQPAEGHGLAHDPFNALVAPRPIGWISSRDRNGVLNLAPYSFFNAFNYHPPIVGFSSIGYKDSVRNAEETGEFCWNLVTRSLSEAMNETCAHVGPEVDEFTLSGLTPKPSRVISAPHVAESPVTLECRVSQVFQLTGADGQKADTWMVFGEVVGVHISRHLIRDGIYDTAAAEPVLRGGGPADYFTVGPEQKFQMHRPKP